MNTIKLKIKFLSIYLLLLYLVSLPFPLQSQSFLSPKSKLKITSQLLDKDNWNYEGAFQMWKPEYPHIPKRLLIDEYITKYITKYIKHKYQNEMLNSYIVASSFTTDGYPTILELYLKDGTEVGYLSLGFTSYFLNKREYKNPVIELLIKKTQIKPNFKKRGVGTLFHAIILNYYPYIYSISSTMGLNNADEYEKALATMDSYDALKKTPSYKIRSKFNFSEIDKRRSIGSKMSLIRKFKISV